MADLSKQVCGYVIQTIVGGWDTPDSNDSTNTDVVCVMPLGHDGDHGEDVEYWPFGERPDDTDHAIEEEERG